MRQNFKVSFYLRSNYENKEGKSPVMLRVFLNREMTNFGSTKVFVDRNLWNNATNRVKGRTAEALSANAALDAISVSLHSIFNKHQDCEFLSLDKIRSIYFGTDKEFTTFLPIFDMFLSDAASEVGKTRSQDSLQKYTLIKRNFEEFLRVRYDRKDIGLNEFSKAVVMDFERYVATVGNCSGNTTHKKVKMLKTIVLYAINRGFMHHNPYAGYVLKRVPVNRGFLTDEEILSIANKDFGLKRLELVRDIFIFSCFTSLAYIDVANLRPDHTVTTDGKQWIL